jgi:hypothetical protein
VIVSGSFQLDYSSLHFSRLSRRSLPRSLGAWLEHLLPAGQRRPEVRIDLLHGGRPHRRARTGQSHDHNPGGSRSVFARPGLDLTLLAREIVCTGGAKIDLSGNPPPATNPKAPNGLNSGIKCGDGGASAVGTNGGNLVIYAGTITGALAVQSVGGAGADAESGGDGAKGAIRSAWTVNAPAGNGGQGGAAGKAGTPGAGGNGGNVVVNTLDTTFSAVTAVLSHGAAGAPGNNGNPGAGGDPGPGGSGPKTETCGMSCGGKEK